MFFTNERQKASGSVWEWGRAGMRRAKGGKSVIRIYYMRKESIFNNMEKRKREKGMSIFYSEIF